MAGLQLFVLPLVSSAHQRTMDSPRQSTPRASGAFPKPRFFTTLRDHFSGEPNTWQQAYYVNASFHKPGGPVFLCVGGEGPPLDGSVVVSSVHCNNAVEWLQETGAIMFAVEHRYYGCHNMSACPYTPADPRPLQWLSSRQALADLAAFHAYATKAYALAGRKWVTFGGSYPGMLASWARLKYPSLFFASASSSAPVIAKLDMQEYNDIVAAAYALPSVGGSASCRELIARGHAEIGQMLSRPSGRAALVSLFSKLAHTSPSWLEVPANQRAFAGEGVAYFPAQSNDPTCLGYACNIARVCAEMTSQPTNASAVERLAALANGPSTTATEHVGKEENVEAPGTDTTVEARSLHSELDYWGYQTCTEFGFYQTCEVGTQCFFTQGLDTLASNDGFCKKYGLSPPDIAANIAATNAFYGAGRPDLPPHNASRIMYINGDVDPWHGLSILEPLTPDLPTLMVAGASHHAWTHPSAPSDQPSVVAARLAIRKQLGAWLRL
mmetsp:Transcript_22469/g.55875  ORF Transcript_22469/g.55875 Transcript_22469/m.55875 type:complete len:496 (+) Transcript_22469:102-1589(+)